MAMAAAPIIVNLDSYGVNMQQLAAQVTVMLGQQRMRDVNSLAVRDVTVIGAGAQVTAVLRVSDLYILGIRNANGTYYFNDPGFNVIGGNALPIGCSYTANNAIGVYRLAGGAMETSQRNRQSIENALFLLQGYAGGGVDDNLKLAFALLTHLLSEALRFSAILSKMLLVLQYGHSFRFADFRDYATQWSAISADPKHQLRPGLWTSHS